MQAIWITIGSPPRIRQWKYVSQFRSTSTKVIPKKRLKLTSCRQWPKGSRNVASKGPTVFHTCVCSSSSIFQASISSTIPDMASICHERLHDRFTEIKSNLRRKRLHRMNQSFNFLEDRFSNRYNVIAPGQSGRESPSILKDYFFSRTDPSIFKSIAPESLDQSIKTSWRFLALYSFTVLIVLAG